MGWWSYPLLQFSTQRGIRLCSSRTWTEYLHHSSYLLFASCDLLSLVPVHGLRWEHEAGGARHQGAVGTRGSCRGQQEGEGCSSNEQHCGHQLVSRWSVDTSRYLMYLAVRAFTDKMYLLCSTLFIITAVYLYLPKFYVENHRIYLIFFISEALS